VYKSEEDVEGELPSFDQYALFPTDEPYRNLADQVISELWVSLSRSTALISLLSLYILEIIMDTSCLYAGLLQMPARTGGKGVSGGLRFL
jgi:hypothetical protein